MKLHLNICDVELWLEIDHYHETDKEDVDFYWSSVNFSLSGKYIDYHLNEKEMLLCAEVDYMKRAFGKLLNGDIKETMIIEFAEPDFEFKLTPRRILYDEPGKVLYRNGSISLDISVDFKIRFWCSDGLGTNIFTMTLNREEINAFYIYLQLVTREIDDNTDAVAEYVKKGYLYI